MLLQLPRPELFLGVISTGLLGAAKKKRPPPAQKQIFGGGKMWWGGKAFFQKGTAFARNSKISVQTRFEPKNLWISFPKDAHIGCPDQQRLPFKGSLLLQNLVGPGYLQLSS